MQVGQRIAKLRQAHGDSLRDAAVRTGVSHTTIARIEKGDVIGSFQHTLRKIAEGYGVRVEFLLGNRDPRQEFLFALHRLSQNERARLYFLPMRARLQMAIDFLCSEFPTEFSLEQLSSVLQTNKMTLQEMLHGDHEDGSPADRQVAEAISRLTGIPLAWFVSGGGTGETSEAPPPENVGAFVGMMKKAAHAGLPPAELEMAIDLLIMKEKGSRHA